jgi:hypothetical protein
MGELIPITSGLIAGVLLGWSSRRRSWRVWLAVAVVLGVLATVVTGEWMTSWGFLLVDIPLVAVCAAAGFRLARWLAARAARRVVAEQGGGRE